MSSQVSHDNHSHDHSHDHSHNHGDHTHGNPSHHVIEDRKYLLEVISSFLNYEAYALLKNHKKRVDFLALSEKHKKLVPFLLEKIDKVDDCIKKNRILIDAIVEASNIQIPTQLPTASAMNMDKVKSTLKQFVRDWSKEGENERKATYEPILNELNEIYRDKSIEEKGDIHVLVPGAGLGRLAYDIAESGFSCQGNEFSYHMLLGSQFILNATNTKNEFEIYPFIHSFSNIKSDNQQLEPILIPDVLPGGLLPTVDFSMVAGDFLEIYGSNQKNRWDVVVTCFFIDTAKNIIDYLQTIYDSLKENGRWINIGPLLYHFENTSDPSIELNLEQVKEIAKIIGFEFKKEKMVSTTYTGNPDGMLKYLYECAFWTAVKL